MVQEVMPALPVTCRSSLCSVAVVSEVPDSVASCVRVVPSNLAIASLVELVVSVPIQMPLLPDAFRPSPIQLLPVCAPMAQARQEAQALVTTPPEKDSDRAKVARLSMAKRA